LCQTIEQFKKRVGIEIVKLTSEILLLIGTDGVEVLAPFTREIFLLDIVVAGTSFCKEIDALEPRLLSEKVLRMIRRPQNKHDDLAIGIYIDQTRIGWVQQELNQVISRLMDAGKAFFCSIQSAKKINKWMKIDAKIYMEELMPLCGKLGLQSPPKTFLKSSSLNHSLQSYFRVHIYAYIPEQ
jgi:hypothetical protein